MRPSAFLVLAPSCIDERIRRLWRLPAGAGRRKGSAPCVSPWWGYVAESLVPPCVTAHPASECKGAMQGYSFHVQQVHHARTKRNKRGKNIATSQKGRAIGVHAPLQNSGNRSIYIPGCFCFLLLPRLRGCVWDWVTHTQRLNSDLVGQSWLHRTAARCLLSHAHECPVYASGAWVSAMPSIIDTQKPSLQPRHGTLLSPSTGQCLRRCRSVSYLTGCLCSCSCCCRCWCCSSGGPISLFVTRHTNTHARG